MCRIEKTPPSNWICFLLGLQGWVLYVLSANFKNVQNCSLSLASSDPHSYASGLRSIYIHNQETLVFSHLHGPIANGDKLLCAQHPVTINNVHGCSLAVCDITHARPHCSWDNPMDPHGNLNNYGGKVCGVGPDS